MPIYYPFFFHQDLEDIPEEEEMYDNLEAFPDHNNNNSRGRGGIVVDYQKALINSLQSYPPKAAKTSSGNRGGRLSPIVEPKATNRGRLVYRPVIPSSPDRSSLKYSNRSNLADRQQKSQTCVMGRRPTSNPPVVSPRKNIQPTVPSRRNQPSLLSTFGVKSKFADNVFDIPAVPEVLPVLKLTVRSDCQLAVEDIEMMDAVMEQNDANESMDRIKMDLSMNICNANGLINKTTCSTKQSKLMKEECETCQNQEDNLSEPNNGKDALPQKLCIFLDKSLSGQESEIGLNSPDKKSYTNYICKTEESKQTKCSDCSDTNSGLLCSRGTIDDERIFNNISTENSKLPKDVLIPTNSTQLQKPNKVSEITLLEEERDCVSLDEGIVANVGTQTQCTLIQSLDEELSNSKQQTTHKTSTLENIKADNLKPDKTINVFKSKSNKKTLENKSNGKTEEKSQNDKRQHQQYTSEKQTYSCKSNKKISKDLDKNIPNTANKTRLKNKTVQPNTDKNLIDKLTNTSPEKLTKSDKTTADRLNKTSPEKPTKSDKPTADKLNTTSARRTTKSDKTIADNLNKASTERTTKPDKTTAVNSKCNKPIQDKCQQDKRQTAKSDGIAPKQFKSPTKNQSTDADKPKRLNSPGLKKEHSNNKPENKTASESRRVQPSTSKPNERSANDKIQSKKLESYAKNDTKPKTKTKKETTRIESNGQKLKNNSGNNKDVLEECNNVEAEEINSVVENETNNFPTERGREDTKYRSTMSLFWSRSKEKSVERLQKSGDKLLNLGRRGMRSCSVETFLRNPFKSDMTRTQSMRQVSDTPDGDNHQTLASTLYETSTSTVENQSKNIIPYQNISLAKNNSPAENTSPGDNISPAEIISPCDKTSPAENISKGENTEEKFPENRSFLRENPKRRDRPQSLCSSIGSSAPAKTGLLDKTQSLSREHISERVAAEGSLYRSLSESVHCGGSLSDPMRLIFTELPLQPHPNETPQTRARELSESSSRESDGEGYIIRTRQTLHASSSKSQTPPRNWSKSSDGYERTEGTITTKTVKNICIKKV